MISLVKIWYSEMSFIIGFLQSNNIEPTNSILDYITVSEICAKNGSLSTLETELVLMDTFRTEFSQRSDLPPDQLLIFGLLSLANHKKNKEKYLQNPRCPFSDIDDNGNTLDPISYETIDPINSVTLNGRCYNTSTIIGLLQAKELDARDPFNSNALIVNLLEGQAIPSQITLAIANLRNPIPLPSLQLDVFTVINLPEKLNSFKINMNSINIDLNYAIDNYKVVLTFVSPIDIQFETFKNYFNNFMNSYQFPSIRLPLNIGINLRLNNEQIGQLIFSNNITILELSNCILTRIPTNINRNIRRLFLSNNNLRNNILNFQEFRRLTHLILEHNHITTMSHLRLPENLTALSLSYNDITEINPRVFPPSLRKLEILHNPIVNRINIPGIEIIY